MRGMLQPRRKSLQAIIGGVAVGGSAPVAVQSMTNTDTADIEATVAQVRALARAGSELVRITVNSAEAAAAVPHIRDRLHASGVVVPLNPAARAPDRRRSRGSRSPDSWVPDR